MILLVAGALVGCGAAMVLIGSGNLAAAEVLSDEAAGVLYPHWYRADMSARANSATREGLLLSITGFVCLAGGAALFVY